MAARRSEPQGFREKLESVPTNGVSTGLDSETPLTAAGFPPSQFVKAYPNEFMVEKIVGLARTNGKFPTFRDFLVAKQNERTLPDKKAFQRFGSKHEIAQKVAAFV